MSNKRKVFKDSSFCAASGGIGQAGQTLVELIVSVFLFSVVVLGGMTFFTLGNNSFERSKQVDFAMQYGYGNIQGMRVNYFDVLYHGGVAYTGSQRTSDAMPMPPTPGGYDYVITKIFTPKSYGPGTPAVLQLEVDVTWPPGQLASQVVDFETLISSPIIGMAM